MNNIAYIDAQNLNMAVKNAGWKIDHKAFRVYLKDKYGVKEAYYYFGHLDESQNRLYTKLQKAGFIVVFKAHHLLAASQKKGNVDTDIVFEMMRTFLEEGEEFEKFVLVSGDGDYKKLVDYLIEKDRFKKILFPAQKNRSSLYLSLGSEYFDFLENLKAKIGRK